MRELLPLQGAARITGSIENLVLWGKNGKTAAPGGANAWPSSHVCMRCVLKIRQHAVLATSVKLQGTPPTTGLVAQCSFNGTYQILSQTAMVALPFVLCSTLFSFGMAKNFPHPATLCFCSFLMKFPSFERKWFGCSPTTSTWNLQHGSHNVFPDCATTCRLCASTD